jgi:hypothetical protein
MLAASFLVLGHSAQRLRVVGGESTTAATGTARKASSTSTTSAGRKQQQLPQKTVAELEQVSHVFLLEKYLKIK